jgi:hypothetical protein
MSRPRVAVIGMQKNERHLLPAWCEYYGKLFGFENIFLVDDASDCERTREILVYYEEKGVHVTWLTPPGKYSLKGEIVWNIGMQCFKEGFEFFYPSDIDEFLVINNEGFPEFCQEEIYKEFESLRTTSQSIFRINLSWLNIPHTTHAKLESCFKKTIFRHDTLSYLKLDHGYHLYDFNNNKGIEEYGLIEPSHFGIIHFHQKPYQLYQEGSKQKLRTRVASFTANDLSTFKGFGHHMVRGILQTPDEYYSECEKRISNSVCIADIFHKQGIQVPFSDGRAAYDNLPIKPDPLILHQSVKPMVDLAKTRCLYESVISSSAGERHGRIEWRKDAGILIHPGDTPTEVAFDLSGLDKPFTLAAWINPLPEEALDNPQIGNVNFGISTASITIGSYPVDRLKNQEISITKEHGNHLKVSCASASGNADFCWAFIGVT